MLLGILLGRCSSLGHVPASLPNWFFGYSSILITEAAKLLGAGRYGRILDNGTKRECKLGPDKLIHISWIGLKTELRTTISKYSRLAFWSSNINELRCLQTKHYRSIGTLDPNGLTINDLWLSRPSIAASETTFAPASIIALTSTDGGRNSTFSAASNTLRLILLRISSCF